jgi:hypothetical protein
MPSRSFLIAYALIVAAVAGFTVYQRSEPTPPIVNKPLPPPPSGELKYAGNPVAHPYMKQEGSYFARTVFEIDGPNNSHIEVRDILIPPKSKSTVAALPGSAVMDLSEGKATLTISGKREELSEGLMRSLPAGQALEFENTESRAATIRLYIIRGR